MKFITRYILLLALILGASTARAEGVTPFADLLVWKASEETSSIWSSVVTSNPNSFAPADIQFDWNAGVRTGISFEPEKSPWDLKLYWTYFRTSQDAAYPAGNQTIIPESFSGFLSGNAFSFTSAAIDWRLTYNTVDLELGHEFGIDDSFSIRPSLGLKVASINQKLDSQWGDAANPLIATNRIDHDFLGIGPSFGVDLRWQMPNYRPLSFVGSFSGALMNGVWNVSDTYERTDPQTTLFTYRTFNTSLNDSSLGTLMLRYFVGLEWTRQGEIPITAHLGWEMQWWANQQRLPTFQQLPMHGDLTLQGVTCGISVRF